MIRIGLDVGGTFTDLVALEDDQGAIGYHKVLSTPADPSEAIERGIVEIIQRMGLNAAQVRFVGHGTTVATNMIIEKRGAPTGMITTKGFRDVLEIGRQERPNVYDYAQGKPPPLVARENRHEVAERIDVAGQVLTKPDEADITAAVLALKRAGLESVAVCLLHSYLNPEHERRVGAVVDRHFPGAYVCLSSEVLPEFREFERFSTTVINAYVGPRMKLYLERLVDRVRRVGIHVLPYTIHSNGGLMSVEAVLRFPVRTCLSGPAAGVVGAAQLAAQAGFPNIVTFDVGGTSTDVALVSGGLQQYTTKRSVAGYPVKTPMVDVHVIGAGGGSIARVDEVGALKVGPESAGADPGPVAHGHGGQEPTLTDANLVLGRLNPTGLLKGAIPIDLALSRRAIEMKIAAPLGRTVDEAADGILQIATSNMARAIRAVSTERGYNISDFALFAYGGAGPLHAVDVARECGMRWIIVPVEPGTMCARGILMSDISFDFVRTDVHICTPERWTRTSATMSEMVGDARHWLTSEGVGETDSAFHRSLDARYLGQNHEVQVELSNSGDHADFVRRFEAAHQRDYGYTLPGRRIEIVNLRVKAVGKVPRATPKPPLTSGSAEDALTGDRRMYCGPPAGWCQARVYDRGGLPTGCQIAGPAIVEEMSSTTVILPSQSARVDRFGNLILDIRTKAKS
jgi:N-methylhydantoinase A